MAVDKRDWEHFHRLGQITVEEDERRAIEVANRDPRDKLREGLELSSFHMQLAVDAHGGDIAGVTALSPEDFMGQASLASRWRHRKSASGTHPLLGRRQRF